MRRLLCWDSWFSLTLLLKLTIERRRKMEEAREEEEKYDEEQEIRGKEKENIIATI